MGETPITHDYLVSNGWKVVHKMISEGKDFIYHSCFIGVYDLGIMELIFIPPWETRSIATTRGVFKISGRILTEYEFKGLPGHCFKLKEYEKSNPITTILELEATLKYIIKSYNP